MRNRKMIVSDLKCPECNVIYPIPRFKNKLRQRNHRKLIWCPMCKDYRNMEELKY